MAFSARYDLSLTDLGTCGWNYTYDGNGSITYSAEWSGCGWWLSPGDVPTDFSSFKKLVVIFEELPFSIRINIEYENKVVATSFTDISAGLTKGELELNPEGASIVAQIYLQSGNGGIGTIVVKEAYLTDGEDDVLSSVYDFESDAIGTVYPMMHAWGWPDGKSSAKVEADPLETSENSLKVNAGNYDGVVCFPVSLPTDFTVADITEIQFDTYFGDIEEQYAAVELFIIPKSSQIGNGVNFNTYPVYLKTADSESKPSPVLQVSSPDEWYTISITREQICDETFNFGVNHNFDAVDALSEFMFGIGINGPDGTEYYLDNIKFILDDNSGIKTVTPLVSNVIGVKGGVIVTANNEKVSIFGIDGRLIKYAVANIDTYIPLQQGLYIVKAGAANATKVLVK